MVPLPADTSLRLFDKPLLSHHEAASRPFPPPKVDASPSPLFPLSPLIFDHELLNDITLFALPPQISSPFPPPLPSPPDKPPSSTTPKNSTNPSPRPAGFRDLDMCGTRPEKKARGGGGGRRLRKDRHSKIRTAQGTRDRRMRLSLDVARKFFDLQDALGFDKASKTVDWLLSSCRSSIMELTGGSSPTRRRYTALDAAVPNAPPSARAKRAAARRRPRETLAAHPPPSREKRQMARARARERAKTKKMLIRRHELEGGGGGQIRKQPAPSPIPFETGEATRLLSTWDQLVAEEGQLASRSPDQYKNCSAAFQPAAVAGVTSAAPISIVDYGQAIACNGDDINVSFVERHQWDVIRPSAGSAEEQRVLFADAQLQLFLWETFNTFSW